MIRNAKRNKVIVGENQTRATLVSCATDATPVSVTVATINVVVDNQQWFLAL